MTLLTRLYGRLRSKLETMASRHAADAAACACCAPPPLRSAPDADGAREVRGEEEAEEDEAEEAVEPKLEKQPQEAHRRGTEDPPRAECRTCPG